MPFPSKESGQGIVEYALIIILVIIIVYIIYELLGDYIINWITELIESINSGIFYLWA